MFPYRKIISHAYTCLIRHTRDKAIAGPQKMSCTIEKTSYSWNIFSILFTGDKALVSLEVEDYCLSSIVYGGMWRRFRLALDLNNLSLKWSGKHPFGITHVPCPTHGGNSRLLSANPKCVLGFSGNETSNNWVVLNAKETRWAGNI